MPDLFQNDVDALASALIGRAIGLPDGRRCVPTSTRAFPRRDNEKGIYKPMLDMRPGDVFVARQQSAFLFLVVSFDADGNGACVLVDGAVIGGNAFDGPGRVGGGIGFTAHRQTGSLVERPDGSLALEFTGVLEPKEPAKPSPKLTERLLQDRMTEVSEAFVARGDETETFERFLERIRAECRTVAELGLFLKRT